MPTSHCATVVTISIIIPVLNEAAGIRRCLTRVLALGGFSECIVVDGGSTDDTLALARTFPVRVLEGPRGRGRQLDLGASEARGSVLLFLHADAILPTNAARAIHRTLADPDVVAGAFRTWTLPDHDISGPARSSRRSRLGMLLHLADLRSRYSRLPYGDQGMFVRAEVFHAAGGFPRVPLMEDLSLSRTLWRFGVVRIARERIRVSGRRFESSPVKQTVWVNLFPFLHHAGLSAEFLAQLYGDPR